MADQYQGFASILSSADNWLVVVPADGVDLANVPKALFFSAAGNVALVGADGNDEIFTVTAGQVLPVRPRRVLATGTTVAAGGIIALY